VFVFFIFIVSNAGGSLTPLGDPPLFLGFLKGVEFFWTVKPHLSRDPVPGGQLLLVIFYRARQLYYYHRREELKPDGSHARYARHRLRRRAATSGCWVAVVGAGADERHVEIERSAFDGRSVSEVGLPGI
jgi:Na+/H+ antiporter NhaD/arsenite permease-like protein